VIEPIALANNDSCNDIVHLFLGPFRMDSHRLRRVIHLLLVRHGESEWNVEGRVQGQASGNPLTRIGRRQAWDTATQLAGRGASRVLSSDLDRAVQTAAIIGDYLGLAAERTAALREQSLGVLEGRYARDLIAEPTPPDCHISEVRWGGGESIRDVFERLNGLCTQLRTEPQSGPVILVSHATALQVLLAILDGRTHREVCFDPINNGEVLEAILH